MKKLQIKEEYKGVVISKTLMSLGGTAIFYPETDEKYYRNYYQIGFQEMFEEVEVEEQSSLDIAKGQVEDYKKEKKKK